MGKKSVTVKIPSIKGTYDFNVPDNMAVMDVQKLMVRILSSEYGVSDDMQALMLMDMQDANVLRAECSFRQLNIQDGARLRLF